MDQQQSPPPAEILAARPDPPMAVNGTGAAVPVARRRRLGGSLYTPAVPVGTSATVVAAAPTPALAAPLAQSPARHRKRRRHRRRAWYRRPLLVIPLAVLVACLVAAGVLVQRAASTVATLHSVSQPPRTLAIAPDDNVPPGITAPAGTTAAPLVTIDTGPARAAVATAGTAKPDDGGLFAGVRDAAANVGNLAGGAAVAAGVKDAPGGALNILVMGVDARPGEPIDIAVRPDALMVLHLNPATGSCRILSVPRDTRTTLPGYGQSKVNHALMVGGIPYERLVVEQLLGLKLDHYVVVDFTAFKELVDAVGGVTVAVPSAFTMEGITFHPGSQRLNGTQALAYARYRGGPDRDLGRIRDQQHILQALLQKASGRDVVADVNSLLPALAAHVRTDLSPAQIVGLADQYRSTCTAGSLRLSELKGHVAQYEDPLFKQVMDCLVVDDGEIRSEVATLLGR